MRSYLQERWNLLKQWLQFWNQRRTRGFDESDLWDLDHVILEFILPRVKALRALPPHATPSTMFTDEQMERSGRGESWSSEEDEKAYQDWLSTLDKIILAISLYLDDEMFLKRDDQGRVVYEGDQETFATKITGQRGFPVEDPEKRRQFEEGWELFHKHFFSLYD